MSEIVRIDAIEVGLQSSGAFLMLALHLARCREQFYHNTKTSLASEQIPGAEVSGCRNCGECLRTKKDAEHLGV